MKRFIAIALAAAVMVTSAPAMVGAAGITVQKAKDIKNYNKYKKGKQVTVKDANSSFSVQKNKDGSMTINLIKNTQNKTVTVRNAKGTNITNIKASAFRKVSKATTADLTKVKLKQLNKNQFKGSKIKTVKMDATKLTLSKINKNALKYSKVKKMILYCNSKGSFNKLVKKLKQSGGKNITYQYKSARSLKK